MKDQPPKLNRTWIPCNCVYKVVKHKRILGLKNLSYGCALCNGTGKIQKEILEIRNDAVAK